MEDKKILIIGVGGCGGNVVSTVKKSFSKYVHCLLIDTDAVALRAHKCRAKLLIGDTLVRRQRIRAQSKRGQAVMAAKDKLSNYLVKHEKLILIAGMGGKTGSGATPFIAKLAKKHGMYVAALLTEPFKFEGRNRALNARIALAEISGCVDSIMLLPNDDIYDLCDKYESMEDAFAILDGRIIHEVNGYLNVK